MGEIHNKKIFLLAKNRSTATEQIFYDIENDNVIKESALIIGVIIQINI